MVAQRPERTRVRRNGRRIDNKNSETKNENRQTPYSKQRRRMHPLVY